MIPDDHEYYENLREQRIKTEKREAEIMTEVWAAIGELDLNDLQMSYLRKRLSGV